MNVTATIRKRFEEGSLRAMADVQLDRMFTIRGVRLVDGKNGLFVNMPSEKWTNRDGEVCYSEIVYPANADIRREIQQCVIQAYQDQTLVAEENNDHLLSL